MKKIYILIVILIFIVIVIYGLSIMIKNKKESALGPEETLNKKCESFLSAERNYALCCVDTEQVVDCSNKTTFKAGEEVEIVFSLSPAKQQLGFLPYGCFLSDLWEKTADGTFLAQPTENCLDEINPDAVQRISGIIPYNKEGEINLIQVNLYPDRNKSVIVAAGDKNNQVTTSDKYTVLDVKGEIVSD